MIVSSVESMSPIAESDCERVFDIVGSRLYRVEVKTPNGTIQVFDGVRAYTESIEVEDSGKIAITIGSKSDTIWRGRIPYPYHYLYKERVLCVLKINKMRMMSSEGLRTFAINHNLLCLPWELCILMNKDEGGSESMLITSRGEWERGDINTYNREIQVFLHVSEERYMPVDLVRSIMVGEIATWLDRCKSEMVRKGVSKV